MWHRWKPDASFLRTLAELDRQTAERVRTERCQYCGGPLHVGNYERKPRGLPVSLERALPPEFSMRWSLCCGHCRRRTTPPSVRFLGRKVYLGFMVFLAVIRGLLASGEPGGDSDVPRVPRRTARRWTQWWREVFIGLPFWMAEHGRFAEAVEIERLPLSLVERFAGSVAAKLVWALCFVAPITTRTASWMRVEWAHAEDDI